MDNGQPTIDKEKKNENFNTVVSGQTSVVSKAQLSYKEKREFETLEKEIAELTKEKKLVDLRLNSGGEPFDELQKLSNRIGEIVELLDKKEMRWLELSDRVQ